MSDCIFCKIANGEIPGNKAKETEKFLAFHDLNPQAPTHVLIIPRKHIEKVADLEEEDALLMGEMLVLASELARELELDASGYRLVLNCGQNAGQEVFHIHLHLLGGRKFSWPPG